MLKTGPRNANLQNWRSPGTRNVMQPGKSEPRGAFPKCLHSLKCLERASGAEAAGTPLSSTFESAMMEHRNMRAERLTSIM